MSVPPEYAWLVPILIPLVIGLLAGVIIRKTLKLVISVAALIIILVATGYISFTFSDIFDRAMDTLPSIFENGQSALNILPYSSTAFLIGLALGLWKG
jgi:uncharacterized membrane protein (Fun14 family)